jgi:hypothetical protein
MSVEGSRRREVGGPSGRPSNCRGVARAAEETQANQQRAGRRAKGSGVGCGENGRRREPKSGGIAASEQPKRGLMRLPGCRAEERADGRLNIAKWGSVAAVARAASGGWHQENVAFCRRAQRTILGAAQHAFLKNQLQRESLSNPDMDISYVQGSHRAKRQRPWRRIARV